MSKGTNEREKSEIRMMLECTWPQSTSVLHSRTENILAVGGAASAHSPRVPLSCACVCVCRVAVSARCWASTRSARNNSNSSSNSSSSNNSHRLASRRSRSTRSGARLAPSPTRSRRHCCASRRVRTRGSRSGGHSLARLARQTDASIGVSGVILGDMNASIVRRRTVVRRMTWLGAWLVGWLA